MATNNQRDKETELGCGSFSHAALPAPSTPYTTYNGTPFSDQEHPSSDGMYSYRGHAPESNLAYRCDDVFGLSSILKIIESVANR